MDPFPRAHSCRYVQEKVPQEYFLQLIETEESTPAEAWREMWWPWKAQGDILAYL